MPYLTRSVQRNRACCVALNSTRMIVDQAAINDGFLRPLNMAAGAETPETADKMASIIHRAIKENPNEIGIQYEKGDP